MCKGYVRFGATSKPLNRHKSQYIATRSLSRSLVLDRVCIRAGMCVCVCVSFRPLSVRHARASDRGMNGARIDAISVQHCAQLLCVCVRCWHVGATVVIECVCVVCVRCRAL